MEIRKVGIAGVGPLGAGVAQACAQSGLEVLLIGSRQQDLEWAEERILRGLHRAEQPAAFGLVRKAVGFAGLDACDLVVETDIEDLGTKKDMLRRLDAALPPPRVIAVGTSLFPVGMIASAVESPERVIGARFFSPAAVNPLVEVVSPEESSEEALADVLAFTARLGKKAVRSKDTPGFVTLRLTRPFHLAAIRLVEQGKGTPATVDRALREEGGLPMGPFERMDALGLEEDMAVSASVYQLSGRLERFRPSALQEKLVARGCRGRRNARGFYVYGENPPGTVNPLVSELSSATQRAVPPAEALRAVLGAVSAEAATVLEEGVATAVDIDEAMRLGLGWPRGPLEWAKEFRR